MYKRYFTVFSILIVLVLVLSACGGAGTEEDQVVEAPSVEEGILSRVLERGYIVCGARTDITPF